MSGKFITGLIVALAVLAGGALYYFQIYHFYERLAPNEVEITLVDLKTGSPESLPVENLEAIDATSSPIRFRACFDTPLSVSMMTETYELYENAEPLNAPEWFDCFDALALGEELEDGRALAFLGQSNTPYGIDLVVAFTDDGRGFAWKQINHCGEKVFDGDPAPAGCPVPPAQ